MELMALFYVVDEFCKEFEPKWRAQQLTAGERQRCRPYQMTLSDILTNHYTLSSK